LTFNNDSKNRAYGARLPTAANLQNNLTVFYLRISYYILHTTYFPITYNYIRHNFITSLRLQVLCLSSHARLMPGSNLLSSTYIIFPTYLPYLLK